MCMHYKYRHISSSRGKKSTCTSYEDSLNNVKWTRCKYPIREVVLGAPDRVNIPCLMHDTRLCQLDVKMTNNYHGTKVNIVVALCTGL